MMQPISCISLVSYIKPQPAAMLADASRGCISLVSYIKPQLLSHAFRSFVVVYLWFPTSNHNRRAFGTSRFPVVYLWFPTSNHNFTQTLNKDVRVVYLWFPTSNHNAWRNIHRIASLYIFGFLHQTTTVRRSCGLMLSCISLVSYIKPQPHAIYGDSDDVVYLWFPTSNHNGLDSFEELGVLYIFGFLHQTTTYSTEITDIHPIAATFTYKK